MAKLGNPITAAKLATKVAGGVRAATRASRTEVITVGQKRFTVGKVLAFTLAGAIVGTVIKTQIKNAQRRNIMKKIGRNPDYGIAMQIYQEIPDKHKKKGSFLNPLNMISSLWANVKIWESSDDQKLLGYASKINDIDQVADFMNKVYGEDLYSLLADSMTPDNYAEFLQRAKRDKTPISSFDAAVANHPIVVKDAHNAYRIAYLPNAASMSKIVYVPTYAEKRIRVGTATGNIMYYSPDKKRFIECKVSASNGKIYTFYVERDKAVAIDPAKKGKYNSITFSLYAGEA